MNRIDGTPYNIKVMGIIEYLNYQVKRFGYKHLLKLTDSNYPRILARGYIDHIRREIVILSSAPKHVLIHEIGHELKYIHSSDKNNIMYPLMNRGTEGAGDIIKEYEYKYGWYHCRELEHLLQELKP